MPSPIHSLSQNEKINFLLTNRIPRRFATQLMGWYSQIKSPLLTRFSLFVWKLFANDLDLSDAKQSNFNSLHECFIRELKPDARTVDWRENIITSPCDAIIGCCGTIKGSTVYQAKGFPYELEDLIPDRELQKKYHNGVFVTLRLKSSMYHRFHAPVDCNIRQLTYISGDTWNVNPVALRRIEQLYCKNERAVVELNIDNTDSSIALVPVAAILVASMKFHCLNHDLNLQYRGPNLIRCNSQYKKGDEIGYFQHGSTIIVFATGNYSLYEGIKNNVRINMGQALLINNSTVNQL
ncbi:MAG TPA: phosphatidylserine decarboxylase [Gammaproteobacteria bacterium]|nr:phosphatidylserine decarboxylase [Gammaproteobacteria bacterium]